MIIIIHVYSYILNQHIFLLINFNLHTFLIIYHQSILYNNLYTYAIIIKPNLFYGKPFSYIILSYTNN